MFLTRFSIVDGIRGHLLIGMLVAHISFVDGLAYLANFHHQRAIGLWDAEFFIPISGFLVGYLYVSRLQENHQFLGFLGKRLWVIYKYYLLAAVPFLLTVLPGMDTEKMAQTMLGIVLVMQGGGNAAILPIYLYCFALLAVLILIGRRFGVGAMTGLSAILYIASHASYGGGFFGWSGDFIVFDIAAWQFLFVLFFWVGTRHADFLLLVQGLARHRYYGLVVLLLVFLLATRNVGFDWMPIAQGDKVLSAWTLFDLHPYYLLRTLVACAALSLLLIRSEPATRPITGLMRWYFSLPFIRAVGRQSIRMFTLHVFMVALFATAAPNLAPVQSGLLALLLIAGFVAAPQIGRFKSARTTPSAT